MKTQINSIGNDWTNVKNKCRTTVNKEYTEKEPSKEFKMKLLIAEHSPIRLLSVDWSWNKIKYWVSTEWSRHKFEKYISTQRTDRVGVNRDDKPQSAQVNFDGFANAQNLIDAWRKRLCFQATKEARELAEDFKVELHNSEPEIADVLVPHCLYRGGCSEMQPCGFFESFIKDFEKAKENNHSLELFNIQDRYNVYNDIFYSSHKERKEN